VSWRLLALGNPLRPREARGVVTGRGWAESRRWCAPLRPGVLDLDWRHGVEATGPVRWVARVRRARRGPRPPERRSPEEDRVLSKLDRKAELETVRLRRALLDLGRQGVLLWPRRVTFCVTSRVLILF